MPIKDDEPKSPASGALAAALAGTDTMRRIHDATRIPAISKIAADAARISNISKTLADATRMPAIPKIAADAARISSISKTLTDATRMPTFSKIAADAAQISSISKALTDADRMPAISKISTYAEQISNISKTLSDATRALPLSNIAANAARISTSTPLSKSRGELQTTFAQVPLSALKSPADLGALVRAARKAAGLDQQALADLAGVGRRFVSELENGKATLEFGKVLTVAAALGIDLLARKR